MAAQEASIEAGLERQLRLHENVQMPTGNATAATTPMQPADLLPETDGITCSIYQTESRALSFTDASAGLVGAGGSDTSGVSSVDAHSTKDAVPCDLAQLPCSRTASSSVASVAVTAPHSDPDSCVAPSRPPETARSVARSGSSVYDGDDGSDTDDSNSGSDGGPGASSTARTPTRTECNSPCWGRQCDAAPRPSDISD